MANHEGRFVLVEFYLPHQLPVCQCMSKKNRI